MIVHTREFFGYKIHSDGRILNNKLLELKQEHIKSRSGKLYARVSLSVNGVKHRLLVHRLVAAAFLVLPSNKLQVDHIDRDTINNCITNLEVVDASTNQKRWRGMDSSL